MARRVERSTAEPRLARAILRRDWSLAINTLHGVQLDHVESLLIQLEANGAIDESEADDIREEIEDDRSFVVYRVGAMKSIKDEDIDKVRAEVVARTEITAAMTEVTARVMAEIPDRKPVAIWIAVLDQRTCKVCGGLHNKTAGKWPKRYAAGPPAHPKCRCTVLLRARPKTRPRASRRR